jgi:ABC-type uncharacterized transport system permease subunit
MPHLFLFLTIAAYVFSLGSYSRYLRSGREISGRLGTVFLILGLVAHYFALLERSRGSHTVPYHDINGSLSLFGWLLALTYLGLELFHRQRSVGAFVMPFVVAFFLAANLTQGGDRLSPPPAHGPVFAFHVTLSILAYAAFALSFVLSLIFLVENSLLRNRNLTDVVWRLPPLELLERMSRSSVLVGIISIAIGTALGFVWVDRSLALRRLLAACAYHRLARRARFASLHLQFCDRGTQFHRCELILVAQSSLLLGSASRGRNKLNLW